MQNNLDQQKLSQIQFKNPRAERNVGAQAPVASEIRSFKAENSSLQKQLRKLNGELKRLRDGEQQIKFKNKELEKRNRQLKDENFRLQNENIPANHVCQFDESGRIEEMERILQLYKQQLSEKDNEMQQLNNTMLRLKRQNNSLSSNINSKVVVKNDQQGLIDFLQEENAMKDKRIKFLLKLNEKYVDSKNDEVENVRIKRTFVSKTPQKSPTFSRAPGLEEVEVRNVSKNVQYEYTQAIPDRSSYRKVSEIVNNRQVL